MIKQSITNYDGVEYEFTVIYSLEYKGRGGYDILCKADFGSVQKTFREYTTDTEFVDFVNKLNAENESFEAIQDAYHRKFFEKFKEEILNFCEFQD